MKCELCGGSIFIKRRAKGEVCAACYPSDSAAFVVFLQKRNVNVRVLEKCAGVSTRIKQKCGECRHTFNFTIAQSVGKIHAGKTLCPACDKPRQLRNMSATLRNRHSNGELKPTKIRKLSFAAYCNMLAKRNIQCLAPDFPIRESTSGGMVHKCLSCEYEFRNHSYNMIRGNGCARCSGTEKKTTESYAAQLNALKDCKYEVVGKYLGARTPIVHRCLTCEGERKVSPDNMLRKFYYKCPNCSPAVGGFKTYKYALGDRQVTLQGYEKFALDFLLRKFKPHEIAVAKNDNVPKVPYVRNGKRMHRPDLYIKHINTLVEVKSLYTLGINQAKNDGGRDKWNDQRAKYKAAKLLGFNYVLLVFDALGRRIQFPKHWYNLRSREVRRQVSLLNQSP